MNFFDRLLKLRPQPAIPPTQSDARTLAEDAKRRGNGHFAEREFPQAERCYREALSADPDYAEALNNLGRVLTVRHEYAEAESLLRRAVDLRPEMPEAHYNLGTLFREQGFAETACAAFEKSLSLRPEFGDAVGDLAAALIEGGRAGEAAAVLRSFVAHHPGEADARLYLATCLLAMGEFEEGWRLHEVRYDPAMREPATQPPPVPFPAWRGEALAGRSLLVWYEQGFGDQIQFCRYVPLLKELGATRVGLACPPALAPLFAGLAGVDELHVAEGALKLPRYDFCSLLLSLPCHCGTRPAKLPYLAAPPERRAHWTERLPAGGKRVGLVWKGNPQHSNDARRSLPGLASLAPLWRVPNLSFVSLQKGAGEDEAAAAPADQPLLDLGATMIDFADSAAIVSQLDLVICVDTAIAHLAGALGKPCWVLLPYIGTDWRWMLARSDSPWYPEVMTLFRQSRPNDWHEPVARVAAALASFAAAPGEA